MHNYVVPRARILGEPTIHTDVICDYLEELGCSKATLARWRQGPASLTQAQDLIEFFGRVCYNSFEPGLNPNVNVIREDPDDYIRNIINSGHGSVLAHIHINFLITGISRVVSHELVRHSVGTDISQESHRYVRATTPLPVSVAPVMDLPVSGSVQEAIAAVVHKMDASIVEYIDDFNHIIDGHPDLDRANFDVKKQLTSFMRMRLPEMRAGTMGWTANIRALRHIIEQRSDPSAEIMMRYLANDLAVTLSARFPAMFGDFAEIPAKYGPPAWKPTLRSKV